jgi:hypothetical protein
MRNIWQAGPVTARSIICPKFIFQILDEKYQISESVIRTDIVTHAVNKFTMNANLGAYFFITYLTIVQ